MSMDFSDIEVRIVDAFFQRYIQACKEIHPILEKFDEDEYRATVARTVPFASKYLEYRTQEELGQKMIILAIAVSVASAIVEGMQLQGQ